MNTDPSAGAMSAVGSASGAADGSPRNSNTGVLITNNATDTPVHGVLGESGNGSDTVASEVHNPAAVDWVSFTIPVGNHGDTLLVAKRVLRWLGEDGDYFDRGRLGYTQGYKVFTSGLVLHCPDRPDMGVHVVLPSGALEFLRCSIEQLIEWVFANGGKFTRIDVAVDSFETPIGVVADAVERRDVVSRCQRAREEKEFWQPGRTIYIGRRVSERFARFYDKQAEEGLPAEVDGEPVIWTRAEIEFKRSQAMSVAQHILNGVPLRDLVFSAIDFRDKSKDSNISRCPRLEWWEKWIGACERVSFVVKDMFDEAKEDIVVTAARAFAWVEKQVAPSLAFLYQASGYDAEWIARLCEDNAERIPSDRLKRLRRANELQRAVEEAEEVWNELLGETPAPDFGRVRLEDLKRVETERTLSALGERFGAAFKMAGAAV